MATDLWLPENLRREAVVERQIELARIWTKIVNSLDPQLSIVFVKDSEAATRAGLARGRWHVKRHNQGTPDSYMPITTPDGGFREPDSGVLEELQQRDMWRTPGVQSEQLRRREAEQRAKEHDAALRQEQRKDAVAEDFRAARRIPGENVDGSFHKRRSRRG